MTRYGLPSAKERDLRVHVVLLRAGAVFVEFREQGETRHAFPPDGALRCDGELRERVADHAGNLPERFVEHHLVSDRDRRHGLGERQAVCQFVPTLGVSLVHFRDRRARDMHALWY